MNEQDKLVQERFGPNAAAYAVSRNHAQGKSLQRLVELMQPTSSWRVLDVATGAGHAALAFAPLVREVVASDITPQMLSQAEQLAVERGVTNVQTKIADAKHLPLVFVSALESMCAEVSRAFGNRYPILPLDRELLKPWETHTPAPTSMTRKRGI